MGSVRESTIRKKAAFVEAYQKSAGSATMASIMSGNSEAQYYRWRKQDRDFNRALIEVEKAKVALADSFINVWLEAGHPFAVAWVKNNVEPKIAYWEQFLEDDVQIKSKWKSLNN